VFVTRFIIKGSIEERILELQEKKRLLATGTLGPRGSQSLKDMRLDELKALFSD
jgi:SNF2 family DNA or RNA helicase